MAQLTKEQLDSFFNSGQPHVVALRDIIEYAQNAGIRCRLEGSDHANVGAVGTGVTVVEYGNRFWHHTELTLAITLPDIPSGAANFSLGYLIYTFPAGAIAVHSAQISLGVSNSEGAIDADTPDGGLGTVIAAGANALLSDTAGAENILSGQTFNNCTGTVELITVQTPLVIEAAGAHLVHFNLADAFHTTGEDAATVAGTVIIEWSSINPAAVA